MNDFADKLLAWFDRHGRRDLPWQQDISPYRVWVSEIMLQQTQVAVVIPYYERFMARFPSVDVLAEAELDEVLHFWTGLGYYARARNLHAAARRIIAQYNGEFPLTPDALEGLPGIGRSTAGAIVAICTNTPATILDGNVKRVLARCFAIDGWPGTASVARQLWAQAERLTPDQRAADYTQAIMDLGAMICTRTRPTCERCPFSDSCLARQQDVIDLYPGSKPKKALPVRETTMVLLRCGAELLLERRLDKGLWGGLWSFPECDPGDIPALLRQLGLCATEEQPLPAFRHTFTHFHLEITPVLVTVTGADHTIAEPGGYCWYNPHQPVAIGLTRPVTRMIAQLEIGSPVPRG